MQRHAEDKEDEFHSEHDNDLEKHKIKDNKTSFAQESLKT